MILERFGFGPTNDNRTIDELYRERVRISGGDLNDTLDDDDEIDNETMRYIESRIVQ